MGYRLLCCAGALLAARACPEQPFHASPVAQFGGGGCPAWACDAAFFRTRPGDPDAATCKPCTPRACPAGFGLTPCNATDDARCARCPDADPLVVFAGDCSTAACADGWWNRSGACAPCPVGAFCAGGGAPEPCGPNETTAASGAWTRLQCSPAALAGGVGLGVGVSFTLAAPASNTTAGAPVELCARPQGVLLDWLLYGAVVGCELTMRDAQGFSWTLLCAVVTSPSATADYVQWLQGALAQPTAAALMQAFLIKCTGRADLLLAGTFVAPQAMADIIAAYFFYGQVESGVAVIEGPVAPPQLVYAPLPWGQSPQDVVAGLAAFGIACTTLPLAGILVCAGVCAQCRRRAGRRRLYDRLGGVRRGGRLAELLRRAAAAREPARAPPGPPGPPEV